MALSADSSAYGVVTKKVGSKAHVDFTASGGEEGVVVKRTDLVTVDPAVLNLF